MDEVKIYLSEAEMPRHWYNIVADMPNKPAPPRHPATGEPVPPEAFSAIFPMNIIEQEISAEREIAIPEEVLSFYRMYRPTPLIRAFRFEKALKTPAKIFYKYEGASPAGSHKLNSAIAQVYYNKQAGTKRITTETGAGQWGSALAMACNFFGLECVVYMVRVSYNQKPYRRIVMETFGATVHASPSNNTKAGRDALEKNPDSNGSLGLAISEAVEDTVTSKDTKYSLGSVLNHVCLHQTVIGQEAEEQLAIADDYPDVVIGCVGGGSNYAGLSFPFAGAKLTGKHPDTELIAVEPAACPTLTKGLYTYDFGDVAGLTPLLRMFTLGHDFIPPAIHAGGLRYHGASPLVSRLVHDGVIRAVAYHQNEVFEAALTFARTEGIIVAPEAAHAVKAAIDQALLCRKTGEEKVILFNNSGHGNFDFSAYEAYLAGKLPDYEYPLELIKESLSRLPVRG